MRQIARKIIFMTLIATVSILTTRVACLSQELPAQKVHRDAFTPVSDEVFKVLVQFFDFDTDFPLEGRIIENWKSENGWFEKIVFTTSTGERVPGQLVLPKNGTGQFPCVLFLHGLGASKDRWWREDRESLLNELIEENIAVFAIDLCFHGERSVHNDYQSPVYLTFGNTLFIRNRDMIIQSTIDSRRALSYLTTRQEIDSTRIAVVGYSMGGMIAIYLSALEDDLTTAVACAVPTTEQPLPIDHFNFAARSKIPTMLLIGSKDWLSSPDDGRILSNLLPLEDEDKKLVFYDSDHKLPLEFKSEVFKWIKKRF